MQQLSSVAMILLKHNDGAIRQTDIDVHFAEGTEVSHTRVRLTAHVG